MTIKNIAVFCGSSTGFNKIYTQQAALLGRHFAKKNIGLIYGGGKVGLMGAIANAVLQNNGSVTGVIPHLLKHEEVAHAALTKMIYTKKMSKRKIKISRLADAYIALPGGFGTLDELFEALTLNQLGIEAKPVGLLNTNGYFDHTLAQLEVMTKEGFLKEANRQLLLVGNSVEELMDMLQNFVPQEQMLVTDKITSK